MNYLWILLVVIGLGLMIWWIFYSQFFKIKNIVIEGTINESIKSEINKFYGQNIFLITFGQKDKELVRRQTSIEKLNIIKGIPDTLKIEVVARSPQIRWKSKDKIYFIDDKGVIFNLEENVENYKDLILVVDSRNLEVKQGTKIVTSDFVEFVKDISKEINDKIHKEIEEIKINDTTLHLEVKFKDSYRVFFDTFVDLKKQIRLLELVKEKHDTEIKEYVDLRVENKAYYK